MAVFYRLIKIKKYMQTCETRHEKSKPINEISVKKPMEKFFEEISKKLLTNQEKYDIINIVVRDKMKTKYRRQ